MAFDVILSKKIPVSGYAYINVTFGAADTDFIVEHEIVAKDPEEVRWIVISTDSPGVVYRDPGTPPRAWGEGYIILKSTVASANVRLLLFLEQE